jgi:hypothetical protein
MGIVTRFDDEEESKDNSKDEIVEKNKIFYGPKKDVAVTRVITIPQRVYDNKELLKEYLLDDPTYLLGEQEYFKFLKDNPGTDKIYEVIFKIVG